MIAICRRPAAAIAILLLGALLLPRAHAQAATPLEAAWVTDGPVSALLQHDGTVYLGGHFSHIAPDTKHGAAIDAATALPSMPFPRTDAAIRSCVADGQGGCYIAGEFAKAGGLPRAHVAHVLPSGAIDPAWAADVNGTVLSMAVTTSTLYLGGQFTTVNSQTRKYLAALSRADGSLLAWNVDVGDDSRGFGIKSLAIAGNSLFVAGTFSTLGGANRANVGAVNLASGLVTPWSADPRYSTPVVNTMIVLNGAIYLGGRPQRNTFPFPFSAAAFDATTGLETGWHIIGNGDTLSLASDGHNIFAGGQTNYARADLSTTNTTVSYLDCNGPISALAVTSTTVYAAGAFTQIGGSPRNYIAALSAQTSAVSNWDPDADHPVSALAEFGSTVFAGGDFGLICRQSRDNLAALDAHTGLPLDFDPGTDGGVLALAARGNVIYAGGDFTNAGGLDRRNLAAFDASTGAATDWDPEADFAVYAIEATSSTLYVGGDFLNIGDTPRSYLAAIDLDTTGTAAAWNPSPDDRVYAIAAAGGRIYAGGAFRSISDAETGSFYLASLDPADAQINQLPQVDGPVRAILPLAGTLYLGGEFTTVFSDPGIPLPRNRAAAFQPLVTPWNPNANQNVLALAVHGSSIYAGGSFSRIGGQVRNHLATLNPLGGFAQPWNPDAGGDVNALAGSDEFVYVGGNFATLGGDDRPNFAMYKAPGNAVNAANWTRY